MGRRACIVSLKTGRSDCMNVEVRGKNMTVRSYQAEYAEKKLAKLNKYLDDEKTAQVALSREGD